MFTPNSRSIVTIGLGVILLIIVGCSTNGQHLQLNSSDKIALKRIYEGSAWRFRETAVDLKIQEGGAVEVAIDGLATRKSQGSDDALWLPVVFLKQLPSYYRVTEASTQSPVELQAYEVPNGLWCITAILRPEPTPALPTGQQQLAQPSTRVKVAVLLVAPAFSSSLPLLVTAGEESRSIDTSVTLPGRAQFTSFAVSRDDKDSPNRNDLTLLPMSLTGGTPKAAARLGPGLGYALDYTNVNYRFKESLLLPTLRVLLFILPLMFGVFYVYMLWRVRIAPRRFMEEEEPIFSVLSDSDIKELKKEYASKGYLRRLGSDQRWRSKFANRRFRFMLVVITSLLIYTLVLVYWFSAQAQITENATQDAPGKLTALGELGIRVESKDPNRLGVTLDFFPLTTASDPNGIEEIGIGMGDGSKAEIEEINVKQSDKVKVTQQSRKMTRLSVPANATKALTLLKALADLKISKFQLPESYSDALNDDNLVRVEYVLSGAQTASEKTSGGRLHLFPFDTKAIAVPIEFQQPAIISRMELPEPSDFVGTPSVNGLDATFEEAGDRYQFNQAGLSRLTLPAHQKVTIQVDYRRSWFQRLFLTVGQLVIAVVAGILLGIIAAWPENKALEVLIGAVGIVGGPWALRASVFSTYKDLPTILSGQRPTLFELIFVLSVFIFIYFAIFTFKKARAV